jgi:hypothetical protein
VSNRSSCYPHRLSSSARCRSVIAVLQFALIGLTPSAGKAYTSAGDRNFPATLVLPQVAPSDAFWITPQTLPMTGGRQTQFTGTYTKTITERFGLQFEDGFTRLGSETQAQSPDVQLQYEAVLNEEHEFILSLQVDQSFGSNNDLPASPATTPAVTFAKGLGDLPIGYLRPLAITGIAGYSAAQGAHPNAMITGLSVQYSIPYLLSKVAYVDLPPILRGMTPITEVMYTTAVGRNYGQEAKLLVAPGVSYTQGSGWEFGIEALIPGTGGAGHGVGVIAQFVVQLDYLLPNSILGRPIFP